MAEKILAPLQDEQIESVVLAAYLEWCLQLRDAGDNLSGMIDREKAFKTSIRKAIRQNQ